MGFAAADRLRKSGIDLPLVGLVIIVLAGALLRLYGLNWDDGHLFHPDERHIMMVSHEIGWPADLGQLFSPESPLNPHSFAYGSLVFTLLKIISTVVSWFGFLGGPLEGLKGLTSVEGMRLVGRVLSTLFDLGTVGLTFLIGRRLYGRTAGIIAALFVSFSVINIQLAHFYASDTLMTFFVMLAILFALRLTKVNDRRAALLVGLAIGLVLATKVSGIPVVLALMVAHLVRVFETDPNGAGEAGLRLRWPTSTEAWAIVRSLVLSGIVALAVFLICEPYALLDFKTFWHDVNEQNQMVRGVLDYPYTRQYADRPAFWYFIENLVVWGVGLTLGIAMVVGLIWACARSFFKPRAEVLVVLAWVVPYFLITGSFQVKFMRYLLPIVPLLAIFAAFLVVSLWLWLSRRRAEVLFQSSLKSRLWGSARYVLVAIVVLPTIFYAAAYTNLYSQEHTAVSASQWIYQNVPNGALIGTEHWEEGLPVSVVMDGKVNDSGNHHYEIQSLNLYEDDNKAKLDELVTKLGKVDYIVFFSQRLYGTIPRLPQRYPMTTQYYQQLFSEQLGFQLEASFTSYPNLAGLSLVDDTLKEPNLSVPASLNRYAATPWAWNLGRADESFTVYDHPMVLVFKKQQALSADELRQKLQPAGWTGQTSRDGGSLVKAALLNSSDEKAMTASGTFSLLFPSNDLENQWPVATWVVLLVMLGLLTLPAGMLILGRLPDGGYGLVRTLSMLGLGWLTWMIVSLRLLPNSRSTIVVALILLALFNGYLFVKNRSTVTRLIREKQRVIMVQEAAFWAAFALFLFIRMANPDLWHPNLGGEKPMDLAYLTAVMKSEWFPPYDPWFAGGYLNYYYFGQVLVGTLIKLTTIVPTVAYNLVIPLLFALTFSGACSCTYNLAALVRKTRKNGLLRKKPGVAVMITGLLGGILAVVAGNLGGAQQLGKSLVDLGNIHAFIFPGADYLASLVGGFFKILLQSGSVNIPSDWFWASTRVIEGTINEFPFFSFLYADLHAHVIALPVTMLVLGLALAWLVRPRSEVVANAAASDNGTNVRSPGAEAAGGRPSNGERQAQSIAVRARWISQIWDRRPRNALPLMAVTALAVGSLAATNFWDYPTYLVIIAGVLFVAWYQRHDRTYGGLLRSVLGFVAIAAISYLLYLPFHANYQSFYFGIEPFPDKSTLDGYLTIHGLLLFAILSLLAVVLVKRSPSSTSGRVIRLVLRHWKRFPTLNRRLGWWLPGVHDLFVNGLILGLGVVLLLIAIGVIGLSVVALLLPVFVVAIILMLQPRRSAVESVLLGLIALGAALGIACEFVAVKGDIGRMNTVFRFYLQTWMLWSIVGAVGLYRAYEALARSSHHYLRFVWTIVGVFLIAACLVYPTIGTVARVSNRFDTAIRPTLDGTAYMVRAVYDDKGHKLVLFKDLEAIRWLQDNVQGSPVVLDGRSDLYRWGSRISVYTGLPTVLGWDWHQTQQRASYAGMIDERKRDVTDIYSSLDINKKRSLLAEYNVRYIYVGEMEQAYYPAAGLAKFDTMVGDSLKLVYDRYSVKIYEVVTNPAKS